MTFSGDTGVLDPAGAVQKLLVRESFLKPTANDVNRIDSLLAMGGTAFAPTDITTLAKALVAFGGQTKPITLADLATLLVSGPGAPFIRSSEAGMVGDGVTDDSFPLQQDMETRSAQGGAVYFLRAAPGASFYFAYSVRVPSNITLLWASPVLLAKEATFSVRGQLRAATAAPPLRLTADAALGATVLAVDTAPAGGGPVSNFLPVQSQLLLSGRRDGCATPTRQQELRVTAVNDSLSQITIHQPLEVAYPVTWPAGGYQVNYAEPDRTQIIPLSIARATANVAAGQNLIPCQAGILVPGDMVLLKDDTTCADISGVPGGDTAPCGEELALVVPRLPADPTASVRLDRRTSRSFSTARQFRLVQIDPVTNVTVSGARFLSAAAPDAATAPVIRWTEQRYARGCVFDGCSVPNTDIFGKRGEAFRAYRTLEALYLNCSAAKAKFVAAGEGNGIVFDRSTGGKAVGGLFDSMRHATQCVGGNANTFHDITILNPRHAPIDLHGTLEVDCHWYDCDLSAGTQYIADSGKAPVAIDFGNPTFLAGPIRCGFHGGSVTGFKSDEPVLEAAINLFPGSRDCIIDSTFHDIGMLFQYEDTVGTTVISSGHLIRAKVNGCANRRLVDIQSRMNGASIDTLLNTRIEVYGRNLNGCFYAVNATELEICNCDIDETVFDPSATYFVEAAACPGLRIIDNKVANGTRLIRLSGCTNYRIVGNRSLDQINSTVFKDDGGNSGIWVDNREVGFLGFYEYNTTSSLTVDGRLPGHYDLPDDSVITLVPIQPKGTGQFYSIAGVSFFTRFFYDTITPLIDLDAVSTSNVDGVTVQMSGTTGVDGRITIAVVNLDNSIQIENRTGGTIRICGRVD